MNVLEQARAAYIEAGFGSFSASDQVLAQLQSSNSGEAGAWHAVLAAQRWMAEPGAGRPPAVAMAKARLAAEPSERRVAGLLCAIGARTALLAFDREAFDEWLATHEALTVADSSADSELWLLASRGWRGALSGEGEVSREFADELFTRATNLRAPALVIEATVLKALSASLMGELSDAHSFARRASRMARTESIPQQEYLANLVLARTRRLGGKPHLAVLILHALLRITPQPWAPWLRWELDLATQPDPASDPALPTAARLVRAAMGGAPDGFASARQDLLRTCRGVAFAQRDVEALALLLSPTEERTAQMAQTAEIQHWLEGAAAPTPRGLHGVVMPGEFDCIAHVLAVPMGTRRRLLSAGTPLATHLTGAEPLSASGQARTDSTLATLLLVGDQGMEEERLFRTVYGFDYSSRRHRSVRANLYRRVQERIDGRGTLHRDEGRIRVSLEKSVLVPDPRCTPPGEHAVLILLAQTGQLTAADAAERLHIPLRTVQHALKKLAEEGACTAEKPGRGHRVEYHLEDTTFCEPTRAGGS